jgi:aryl-phospho-beta-D-glucosidase BglC (GH1 family)
MRGHWENWFNESWMDKLAERGVERVRLPVGDWTIN